MSGELVDKKLIAQKRDNQKRDTVTRDLVTRTLLGSKEGRRYVYLELTFLKVFESTISFGPGGALVTAFNEGKRSVGLRLLADVTRVSPQGFVQMLLENSNIKEEKNDGSSDTDGDGSSDPGDPGDE